MSLVGEAAQKAEGGGKYFVKPTIFTGVSNRMRIAQEEVFGPVLSVITVSSRMRTRQSKSLMISRIVSVPVYGPSP